LVFFIVSASVPYSELSNRQLIDKMLSGRPPRLEWPEPTELITQCQTVVERLTSRLPEQRLEIKDFYDEMLEWIGDSMQGEVCGKELPRDCKAPFWGMVELLRKNAAQQRQQLPKQPKQQQQKGQEAPGVVTVKDCTVKETPDAMKTFSLMNLRLAEVPKGKCCQLHATGEQCIADGKLFRSMPCRTYFGPPSKYLQCNQCLHLLMVSPDGRSSYCDICGDEAGTAEAAITPVTSTAATIISSTSTSTAILSRLEVNSSESRRLSATDGEQTLGRNDCQLLEHMKRWSVRLPAGACCVFHANADFLARFGEEVQHAQCSFSVNSGSSAPRVRMTL